MASRWYVIRTEPRAEYLATNELGLDGIEVYFPIVRTVTPNARRADAPLFPGYLFIHFDPDANGWPAFRPGHRILGWVSFGREVPPIPDEAIAELKQSLEAMDSGGGLWRRFHPGETVMIVSGSVQGLAKVVEETRSPQSRVKVLLSFMGRLVPAQVPWENVRPVADQDSEVHRPPRRTRGGGRWIQGYGPRAANAARA